MSKIEKALEKAKRELEKKAEQTPKPTPENHRHADFHGQNTSDTKTAKHKSRIM